MKDFYDPEIKEERCGLLLEDGEIIETKNVHPEPDKGFEIDPKVILERLGDITGTWHTHPNKDSILSEDDIICYRAWPDLDHFILGRDGIRKYVVNDRGVVIVADYTSW